MGKSKSWFGRGNTRAVAISTGVFALLVTPFAFAVGEGQPVEGGERNPSNNRTQAYERETEIIGDINASGAQKGGYVTRQSNTETGGDAGGGAIYGCRSTGQNPDNDESCIRANNLANGLAFSFDANGTLGGTISVGNGGREEKPFITDATGVATGLNADEVDGLDASEIAQQGNIFARVNPDGGLAGNRGATASARTAEGVYTVTFAGDISACALEATQANTVNPGTISVQQTQGNNNQVTVRTFDESEDPFTANGNPNTAADGNQPEDRSFHLTVTC